MSTSERIPESLRPRSCWRRFDLRDLLTPGGLAWAMLGVQALLWLSGRFRWFVFDRPEGWAVLVALAAAGAAMLLMLAWFAAALIFRRRFQFGIRSLLVFVVAVALPCSRLAAQMRQAKEQKEAVQAISQLGGRVTYDYEYPPVPPGQSSSRAMHPPGPAWLRNLLGADFFAAVVQVTLDAASSGRFTDADLRHLRALPGLEDLILGDTRVTDRGLEQLKGLGQLRKLSLSGGQFTDAGIGRLSGLPRLAELCLWRTQVTDAGLQSLGKSATLVRVWTDSARITAEGEERFRHSAPNRQIDRWISPE